MKKIHLAAIAALSGLVSSNAFAQLSNKDVLDTVIERYQSAAAHWGSVMTGYASYLFWGLALLSMVVTFGYLALKQSDPMEFFAEFFKFSFTTGFFFWILTNGPKFAISIIDSLRKAGGTAANVPGLGPSGIVDIGFNVFFTVLDKTQITSPIDSLIGVILGIGILIPLALIAVNMLLLLISGWMLAYGGVFFLGFGGARWTSDMAIAYYKSALGIGAAVMGMTLIAGVGQSLISEFYTSMSAGLNLKEMTVMLVLAITMFKLCDTVPRMLAGLAGEGGASAASAGNVGLGSLVGAAAVAGGAMATGGALAMAGAANLAGGASALKAAFTAAQENMANGTGMFAGGEGLGGSTSSLAQAMGSAQASGASNGVSDFLDTSTSEQLPENNASVSSASAGGAGVEQSDGAEGESIASTAAGTFSNPSSDVDESESGKGGAGQGQPQKPSLLKTGARFAADMSANLAKGVNKVATDKAKENLASIKDAISNTAGGQVASAIKENSLAAKNQGEEDSLSPGEDIAPTLSTEAREEIQAFVNKA